MPQDEIRIEVVAGRRDGRSDVRWMRGDELVAVSAGVTPADAARIVIAWDTHRVQVRRHWRKQWIVVAGIGGAGPLGERRAVSGRCDGRARLGRAGTRAQGAAVRSLDPAGADAGRRRHRG